MIERNTDEVHGPDLAIIVPRDRRRRRMAGDCSKPPPLYATPQVTRSGLI